MSILEKGNYYSFLDHRAYITSLYKEVIDDKSCSHSFEIINKLFCIKTKQTKEGNRKRKCNSDIHSETLTVKKMYDNFMTQMVNNLTENENSKSFSTDIKEVRELSHHIFETTSFDYSGLSGGNNSEKPMKCKVMGDYFLIPQHSRFLCGSVNELCLKLNGNKYDILIADPPWWNKYIRRLKNANDKLSYSMMYNEDIANVPVKNLLSRNCMVAVWCTNAPSNIDAVKNLIFPKWGVEYITTWYWLKVTIDFEPLCPFNAGCKKQPYERLIIGKVGQISEIPKENLIISVPSALHSHKPPLLDILKPYLEKENPEVLELFARYLLPNTTSVGFEPLKWQHISLYELSNKDVT